VQKGVVYREGRLTASTSILEALLDLPPLLHPTTSLASRGISLPRWQ